MRHGHLIAGDPKHPWTHEEATEFFARLGEIINRCAEERAKGWNGAVDFNLANRPKDGLRIPERPKLSLVPDEPKEPA